jgi:hypothetical protein
MRFQVLAAALVVFLTASGLAPAATRAGAPAKPDLVVGSVSTQDVAVILGSGFTARDRTRNVGSASARATVTRYYLSAEGHSTAVGRRSIARLKPNRSSAGPATLLVPATLQTGIYSLVACADGSRTAAESNERNNCRTAALKISVKKPPPRV